MSIGFARILCTVALTILLLGPAHGQASKAVVSELRLSVIVLTPTVKQGEPVKVRIELKNDGCSDVAVARWLICIANSPSCLSFEFEDESGIKRWGETSHSFPSVGPTDDYWTQIAPSHYCGVEDRLEGLPYEFLKKPGRYKVTARYVSHGGLTRPGQGEHDNPQYDVWKGEIVSNSATFEVLPPAKDTHAEK
jgi:hypothetical protein